MASVSVTGESAGLSRLLRRPSSKLGFWGWITTVDHKRIGILYGVTAFLFFLAGGIEALLLRLQLARPDGTVLSAAAYNQIFTMHGITMIFLVVMPLSAAFFNFLVPLMIGARDVAFPRLNAFSYWVFLFGGLFIYSSFFLGGAPNSGWFAYAPLSETVASSNNMLFYAVGLIITGIASSVSAINIGVTIINMRAPGMSLFRMPVFIWMTFVVQALLAFALPVITIGLFELLFDRRFGTHFFDVGAGGDPVLWQHLFWVFGHPEVYILVLPAMGIVSEVLPVFSRKPLFGYQFVVFSGIAIGFMGWGVWAHHMFTTGLGPIAESAFSVSTMMIAVPTGVKIFNWMATMWKGDLHFKTPMLFSIGFVSMFIIGGLSGVTHAVVPADYMQTDTYYIVAHFHYVLFGGAIFGLMSGFYYWWPKIFGRMLSETLGKIHFWTMLIGFNVTFGPFHILGLEGMPRRIYRYSSGQGWDFWNFVSTIGAFTIALSIVVFLVNVIVTQRKAKDAPADPWDGRTLEWTTSSPPPEHNFDEVPVVHSLDDFWHRKYAEDQRGRVLPVPAGAADTTTTERATGHGGGGGGGGHGIHLPSPSYFPVIAALGFPLIGYGVIFNWAFAFVGAVRLLGGLYAWALEPSAE
ncbi:MAG: cytochrome c oxidase subunit I [Actinomycetota bacterium]|nr:cytochrome c oxidase subunit I [Actinomycetota bacterium]